VAVALTVAAAAVMMLAPPAAGRWAWTGVFGACLAVLPWRSWRGLATFGGLGTLILAAAGIAGHGGAAPWEAIGILAVAVGGLTVAEAARSNRWRRALRDPVTGLAGKTLTRAMLSHEVAAARRGRPLSVVLMGLSGEADERRLRTLGEALRHHGRAMDIVGRLDEDTFLGILPSESPEGAAVFASRLRRAAADLPSPGGPAPDLGAGIASFERDSADEATLLERATEALRAARAGGRDAVLIHTRSGLQPAAGVSNGGM